MLTFLVLACSMPFMDYTRLYRLAPSLLWTTPFCTGLLQPCTGPVPGCTECQNQYQCLYRPKPVPIPILIVFCVAVLHAMSSECHVRVGLKCDHMSLWLGWHYVNHPTKTWPTVWVWCWIWYFLAAHSVAVSPSCFCVIRVLVTGVAPLTVWSLGLRRCTVHHVCIAYASGRGYKDAFQLLVSVLERRMLFSFLFLH